MEQDEATVPILTSASPPAQNGGQTYDKRRYFAFAACMFALFVSNVNFAIIAPSLWPFLRTVRALASFTDIFIGIVSHNLFY
jgi:hypothetical protein